MAKNELTEQEYELKFKSKARLEGGGGGDGQNRPPPLYEHISNADLALTFNWRDATLKVIKDRQGLKPDEPGVSYAINQFSSIISRMVFGDNELNIFEEGLSEQIKESIKQTIDKYHGLDKLRR